MCAKEIIFARGPRTLYMVAVAHQRRSTSSVVVYPRAFGFRCACVPRMLYTIMPVYYVNQQCTIHSLKQIPGADDEALATGMVEAHIDCDSPNDKRTQRSGMMNGEIHRQSMGLRPAQAFISEPGAAEACGTVLWQLCATSVRRICADTKSGMKATGHQVRGRQARQRV